ncbi:MAG: hypothetical protein ACK42A_12225 [Pyrinomonadaceae bacterium]
MILICFGCHPKTSNSDRSVYENKTDLPEYAHTKVEEGEDNMSDPESEKDILDLPIVREPERNFAIAIELADKSLETDPDLKPSQRDLRNYVRHVREDKHFLYVVYNPRTRPTNDSTDGSGETEIARDLYFIIRKGSNELVGRKFRK